MQNFVHYDGTKPMPLGDKCYDAVSNTRSVPYIVY